MAEELGRIEKPSAERFQGERKLYLVPLLYTGKDAPQEYLERFELYWQQVEEQIYNQESKIGKARRVYHELIAVGGEEGLKILEELNPPGYKITRQRAEAGAEFEATEEAELANECMDWERFLLFGFLSRSAAGKVSELYRESARKRYEHIAQRIDETLGANEVAILFIREEHQVQFPQDIEVFMVAPPALDAIHRWLRERPQHEEPQESAESDQQEEPDKQEKPQEGN
ncbi:MAG: hypothetical protein JSV77_06470 [Dehalococcoidales bacterium]|nr:MAG: hypothetical protein JSV77_06470 [Dehalococcoidales bacterium]